jgi:phenylalanyl-tRNA synthetase alpha chain
MVDELKKIQDEAKRLIDKVTDRKALEELRVKYLGKKGPIKDILGKIGAMSDAMKKEVGQTANEIRDNIDGWIETAATHLEESARASPAPVRCRGHFHADVAARFRVISSPDLVTQKMAGVFRAWLRACRRSELEDEYYNFEAMNMPYYHPARDSQDCSIITDKKLMRTHTSPMQARGMKSRQPPIAVVVPGRCYRRDAVDATHMHTFYQMEGLVVDKGITFADLKGALLMWAKLMFGSDTKIRMRPDYFPFTEPSGELAVDLPGLQGQEMPVCKHTGWIEIGGCGLVNPEVFKNVGYDPDEVSGFAFGMGLERVAMVVYGIHDIRLFTETICVSSNSS